MSKVDKFVKIQQNDQWIREIIAKREEPRSKEDENTWMEDTWFDNNGILRRTIERRGRRTINPAIAPQNMRKDILFAAHTSPLAGHGAIFRTKERIIEHFWWPSLNRDVEEMVKTCPTCQIQKGKPPMKAPLISLDIPTIFNQRVHMDLMGELKCNDDYKYILTITDAWSKYAIIVPLKDKKAETIMTAFFDNWVAQFSCPKAILSDQGKEFDNEI